MFLSRKPISQILLLFTGPLLLLLVGLQGGVALFLSLDALQQALGRSVQTKTMAISYELSSYLRKVRYNTLLLADFVDSEQTLGTYLNRVGGLVDKEALALVVTAENGTRSAYVREHTDVRKWVKADGSMSGMDMTSPVFVSKIKILKVGEVAASQVFSVRLPAQGAFADETTSVPVIQFVTPLKQADGKKGRLLSLYVAADHIGEMLTYLQSPASPLHAFHRRPAKRFSYFADPRGWILYESAQEHNAAFMPVQSRQDLRGTLGLAGMPGAFLPSDEHSAFWDSVSNARNMQPTLNQDWESENGLTFPTIMMEAGAPVLYRTSDDAEPEVWGVAFSVDRSLLPHVLGTRQAWILCGVGVVVLAVSILVLYLVGRFCAAPMLLLARKVEAAATEPAPTPVEGELRGYEANVLQQAINRMIRTLNLQLAEINDKTQRLAHYASLQQVEFTDFRDPTEELDNSALSVLRGSSSVMRQLKAEISKAAQVDADILIEGETGTGKQLVAEAVHKASRRCNGPLVPINCGALDESLLLDALFGHKKGAFSGAENDRDGAFVHAHGGTLFLDEIQSASPKVQQSLLRVIASRRVRPLGTDAEYPVDVRVICATNVNLLEEIEAGKFRQDLYYRIKVLSLHTPPLRTHTDSIPALTAYFLEQARETLGRSELALTRGAMEALLKYSWPGNVRELENCIIQAAVTARDGLIHVADLPFSKTFQPLSDSGVSTRSSDAGGFTSYRESESKKTSPFQASKGADSVASYTVHNISEETSVSAISAEAANNALNERQQRIVEYLQQQGSITRRQYLELFDYDISDRTAGRDLQDLVQKGIIRKSGAGPSTSYVFVK
ncbi:sigma 54-interacting transcriptional regulator [Oleidesulfovibrio sp.]|uniref:sigma 54-interacting transcriptional regulator n=1 Tax=Oleidesulfovibrio sp. TaxID=2909707 RepID=UPI003A8C322A